MLHRHSPHLSHSSLSGPSNQQHALVLKRRIPSSSHTHLGKFSSASQTHVSADCDRVLEATGQYLPVSTPTYSSSASPSQPSNPVQPPSPNIPLPHPSTSSSSSKKPVESPLRRNENLSNSPSVSQPRFRLIAGPGYDRAQKARVQPAPTPYSPASRSAPPPVSGMHASASSSSSSRFPIEHDALTAYEAPFISHCTVVPQCRNKGKRCDRINPCTLLHCDEHASGAYCIGLCNLCLAAGTGDPRRGRRCQNCRTYHCASHHESCAGPSRSY